MPFRERGEDEDVREAIDCRQLALLHYPGELDLDPELPGQRLEIAAERPRTDHDVESTITDVGRGGHDGLEVLLCRQATDIEDAPRTRAGRRAGRNEELGVHAIRDQLDARG